MTQENIVFLQNWLGMGSEKESHLRGFDTTKKEAFYIFPANMQITKESLEEPTNIYKILTEKGFTRELVKQDYNYMTKGKFCARSMSRYGRRMRTLKNRYILKIKWE